MVYSGKVKVNKKGKFYVKVKFKNEPSQKFDIDPEALEEMHELFEMLPETKHELLFSVTTTKKGDKIAIPMNIKIHKKDVDNPKLLELLKKTAVEIKDEKDKEDLGVSFEEFSQQNWTNFIEALKKEFGSRIPGYAAFEKFARAKYTGPADKLQMS